MYIHDLAPAIIRKLWPADIAAFRRHLKRLDMETRQLRFGMAVNEAFLDAYADTASRPGTVIYGAFLEGGLRATAEFRPLEEAAEPMAEAAFTVEKPYQDHGLGSELLDRVITTAQNRGIHHLHMVCLKDNGRMQHLADKFGARITVEPDSVTGTLETPHPTPISLFEEGLRDAQGFVSALLAWPARA